MCESCFITPAEAHGRLLLEAVTAKCSCPGKIFGLGLDVSGIHITIAARFRVASGSAALSQGVTAIQEARDHRVATLSATTPHWEAQWLSASNLARHLHGARSSTLTPCYRLQSAASPLLRAGEQPGSSAQGSAARASNILGPVSRRRVCQILEAFLAAG